MRRPGSLAEGVLPCRESASPPSALTNSRLTANALRAAAIRRSTAVNPRRFPQPSGRSGRGGSRIARASWRSPRSRTPTAQPPPKPMKTGTCCQRWTGNPAGCGVRFPFSLPTGSPSGGADLKAEGQGSCARCRPKRPPGNHSIRGRRRGGIGRPFCFPRNCLRCEASVGSARHCHRRRASRRRYDIRDAFRPRQRGIRLVLAIITRGVNALDVLRPRNAR